MENFDIGSYGNDAERNMVLKDKDYIHIKDRNNRRLSFRDNKTLYWYWTKDTDETKLKVIK